MVKDQCYLLLVPATDRSKGALNAVDITFNKTFRSLEPAIGEVACGCQLKDLENY